MLQLLKAEFDYAKWGLLFFIFLIPPAYIWWTTSVDSEHGIQFTLWLAFMLNTMIPQPKKEKRERFLNVLPVSIITRGMARVLMVILPCLAMIFFIYVLPRILNISLKIDQIEIWGSFGIILIIYGIYFIFQDIVSGRPPRSRSRIKLISIITLISVVVLFIIGIILEEATDSVGFGLNQFVDSIDNSGILSGINGIIRFVIFSVSLFFVSLVTYYRRSSFAE